MMDDFEKAVEATLLAKQLLASLRGLNNDASELLHLHMIPLIEHAHILQCRLDQIASALAPKASS